MAGTRAHRLAERRREIPKNWTVCDQLRAGVTQQKEKAASERRNTHDETLQQRG
jgi:hypothetical protein